MSLSKAKKGNPNYKIFTCTILIILCSFQHAKSQSQIFNLKGACTDIEIGTVKVQYKNAIGKTIKDTCRIEKGSFWLQVNSSIPIKMSLRLSGINNTQDSLSYSLNIYGCSGNFQIECSIALNHKNISFGCLEAEAQRNFDSKIDSILIAQKQSKNERAISTSSSSQSQEDVDKILSEKITALSNLLWTETRKHAIETQQSYLLPEALFYAQSNVPMDSLAKLFYELYPFLQKIYFTAELKKEVDKFKSTQIGSILPTIISLNQNDSLIDIKQIINGKIYILEFWASWCLPCIQNNKEMNALMEKYRHVGLGIIGISWDHDRNAWNKAIEKQQLAKWIHISFEPKAASDIHTVSTSPSKILYCNGLPLTIIVDRAGRIIGKWDGYSSSNYGEITACIVDALK